MPGLLDVVPKIVEDPNGGIDDVVSRDLVVPAETPPDVGA
jgi:hypothetical protein